MRVRVVDASALGALVFGEPKAEEAAAALVGGPMVSPPLLWFEAASICLKKIRTHPLQAGEILKAFSLASRLAIEIIEVEHLRVIELARDSGLTTYDASYIWLALNIGGALVTLDENMQKVAARLKIKYNPKNP